LLPKQRQKLYQSSCVAIAVPGTWSNDSKQYMSQHSFIRNAQIIYVDYSANSNIFKIQT
jgi:hypothetical protein